MVAVRTLAHDVGTAPACVALGVPRATWYRRQKPPQPRVARPSPPRKLRPEERSQVLDHLNSERFVDVAPATVHATLLDEGIWLCSPRTMHRLLAGAKQIRERRNQLRHPAYAKPEIIAIAPRRVWSWDITKLKGPVAWTYFYLYVILDIFSRYVVGWMLATTESAAHAKQLIAEACLRERIDPNQLTVHSDRGAPMTSHTVSQLFAELGVVRSLSRPQVSNDNPFSESQFKTLKYRPSFPDRFGSFEDALAFCRAFFPWYNTQHRHSGIAWLTPADVHFGSAARVLADRQRVLSAAYALHPERFVRRPPTVAELPQTVWINPPTPRATRQDAPGATMTTWSDPKQHPETTKSPVLAGNTGSVVSEPPAHDVPTELEALVLQ